VDDIEAELREMDRVVHNNGQILIVERMCAISETPRAIKNLKLEPELLSGWFDREGYDVEKTQFKATYWGESLTEQPQFNFYLVSAYKPKNEVPQI